MEIFAFNWAHVVTNNGTYNEHYVLSFSNNSYLYSVYIMTYIICCSEMSNKVQCK
jgi:hypothetical protein